MYWSNPTPVAAALYLCDLKSPPLAMGANMTHPHTVAIGNTEYVFPTIIRSYCPLQPTTTHQLEEKDRMDNYVCMDYQTSILILISIVLNFVTLVIVIHMTKRNCTQGVRI